MAFTFNPLWKTLVDKNMNKEDLRKLINASPSTIAKLSKDEYVALRVLDDICQVLNVKSISEVVEFVSDNGTNSDNDLSEINNIKRLNRIINVSIDFPQYSSHMDKEIYQIWREILLPKNIKSYTKAEKEEIEKALAKCVTHQLLSVDNLMQLMMSLNESENS